jgi:hypothetical protein
MGRESTEKERTTMNTASNGERNQESKNNTKKKEKHKRKERACAALPFVNPFQG